MVGPTSNLKPTTSFERHLQSPIPKGNTPKIFSTNRHQPLTTPNSMAKFPPISFLLMNLYSATMGSTRHCTNSGHPYRNRTGYLILQKRDSSSSPPSVAPHPLLLLKQLYPLTPSSSLLTVQSNSPHPNASLLLQSQPSFAPLLQPPLPTSRLTLNWCSLPLPPSKNSIGEILTPLARTKLLLTTSPSHQITTRRRRKETLLLFPESSRPSPQTTSSLPEQR